MNKFPIYMVVCASIWLITATGAYPQSVLDLGSSRTQRRVSCSEDLEYPNGNICCLNCPAGTHMKSPCTTAGEKGTCEECDFGTFTEHANHLQQCLKCSLCQPDQEAVRPCTHTQDTECQCKSGRFCDPNQACEVCKRCSRCESDEVIVRNCTSTTNTECKKIQAKSDSVNPLFFLILPFAVAVVVGVIIFIYKRSHRTDSQENHAEGLKDGSHYIDIRPIELSGDGETRRPSSTNLILGRQLVRVKSLAGTEDERKMLCPSLNSSASNSQHSLTDLPASPARPPRANPVVPRPPDRREDEQFPKLLPVNGEESLRKCFVYFEDLDVDYHKRFFRQLDINDNIIKSKEHLPYEDKIHSLLNIWIEKRGRDASLNDLLQVLLALNQKRTAELVKENAIHNGHYFCEV